MRKKRILIVEDDDSTRETLMELCGMYGFKCMCAISIKDAMVKASEFKPDLIYLDVKLGCEIGLSLIPWLRENLHPTPFIIVASALNKAQQMAEPYGPDCFIPKPFSIDTLEEIFLEQKC